MANNWKYFSLGDIATLERRPVKLDPDKEYAEIGIYSFGRGIFHKLPRTGFEVGNKDLYLINQGDFILQITFAWEGAVGLATEKEDSMYGSVRFPTFRIDKSVCYPPFLLNYFRTEAGRSQLAQISPGSAGRNRVLSLKRIAEVKVPLPPLDEQRRIVARIEALAGRIAEAQALRQSAAEEAEKLLDRAITYAIDQQNWKEKRLEDVLLESPRNGLAPQHKVETDGKIMLRINAVSSSPDRYVDTSAYNLVDVAEEKAQPFYMNDGEIFVVRYNGDINRLAKAAIFKSKNNEKVIFPDKLIRLRANHNKVLSDFLVYALGSRKVRSQVEERGKTTAGNLGISGKNIKAFTVSVPPLDEQRRIVAYLDGLSERVNELRRLQSESQVELDALLPSVLDRAFKGEL